MPRPELSSYFLKRNEVSLERARELQETINHHLSFSREGFTSLTKQLAEPLKRGDYSSIIVDKNGGALPAIVVTGLAKRWADETQTQAPATIDLPGGRHWINLSERKKARFIKNILPRVGSRNLIVTEVLTDGFFSAVAYRDLIQNGIAFDIAAFETYSDPQTYWKNLKGNPFDNTKIYSGRLCSLGLKEIFKTRELIVARGIEENPMQFTTTPFTRAEQRVMITAAHNYLNQLTDALYATHVKSHQ